MTRYKLQQTSYGFRMYDTLAPAPTAPGSTASQAVWQIKKLDTNTLALDKTWAAGGASTQVWNDRAGLGYDD